MYLLCRNRVRDFDAWKAVFDTKLEAAQEAGLTLVDLWREVGDPDNAFFLFEIESVERAEAFMAAPESVEAGRVSGVIDGEAHFVERVAGP
jgi:hypothetical protein